MAPLVVELLHTGDLDAGRRAMVRRLLEAVFEDLTDADWEHCLGGVHALGTMDGELIAHAALVARRLGHRGRPLRAGYVEAVAVRPDRQRRGLGSAVMAPLERLARAGYDLGALAATDDGARFYAARGWLPWRGRTWALTPAGVRRTPDDDDCVFVLPGAIGAHGLDRDGDLIADWRDDDAW